MRNNENRCFNLEQFIEEWDSPFSDTEKTEKKISVSELGNINIEGSSVKTTSYMVTKNDPRFLSFVEVGVRGLVKVLIEKLNCITYSSCEGHVSSLLSDMQLRHIGIVPRNNKERVYFLSILSNIITNSNEAIAKSNPLNNCFIALRATFIDFDNNKKMSCLDIDFLPIISDEIRYFEGLEEATSHFIDSLIKHT